MPVAFFMLQAGNSSESLRLPADPCHRGAAFHSHAHSTHLPAPPSYSILRTSLFLIRRLVAYNEYVYLVPLLSKAKIAVQLQDRCQD
jgi:hypothetical protein